MAFTGVPTFERISDRCVRMSGAATLGAGASATVGLFGDATADENLPDNFNPVPYADKTLSDAIEVTWNIIAPGVAAPDIAVAKAEGPFQVTFTNGDGVNATAIIEAYFRWR